MYLKVDNKKSRLRPDFDRSKFRRFIHYLGFHYWQVDRDTDITIYEHCILCPFKRIYQYRPFHESIDKRYLD